MQIFTERYWDSRNRPDVSCSNRLTTTTTPLMLRNASLCSILSQKCKRSRKMSLRGRDAFIASVLLTSIFLLGCEPYKLMKDYFGAQGLNPLAALRSDVEPGALILKQRDKTIFAESIFAYSTGQKPAVTTKDLASIELNGVLGKSSRTVRSLAQRQRIS